MLFIKAMTSWDRKANNAKQPQQLEQPQFNGIDLRIAQQFLAMMGTFAQATVPQQPTPPSSPPPLITIENTRNTTTVVVELFRKQHPPTFEGDLIF